MNDDEPLKDPYGTTLAALAKTERIFRSRGLPACALGYDRRHSRRLRLLLIASGLLSALIIVPATVFAPQYARWVSLVAVILLCTQAYAFHISKQRPESSHARRLLETTTGRGWQHWARHARVPVGILLVIITWLILTKWIDTFFGSMALSLTFSIASMLLLTWIGGGISLVVHLIQRLGHSFISSSGIAAREMPLLFPSLLIVFVTDDAWRLFGQLEGWRYWVVLGLLMLVAFVVLLVRSRSERQAIFVVAEHADTDRLATLKKTPLAVSVSNVLKPYPEKMPAAVRRNAHLMLMSTAVVRVTLVGLATAGILIIFGLFVADTRATTLLLEIPLGDVRPLYQRDIFGSIIIITEPLVRLTGILGALASLYFSISVPQGSYREFTESLTFMRDELDQAADSMVLYAYYLSAHVGTTSVPPSSGVVESTGHGPSVENEPNTNR